MVRVRAGESVQMIRVSIKSLRIFCLCMASQRTLSPTLSHTHTHTHMHTITLTTLSTALDMMNVGLTPVLRSGDPAHTDPVSPNFKLGKVKTGATVLLWAETKMAAACRWWGASGDVHAVGPVSWPATVKPLNCRCTLATGVLSLSWQPRTRLVPLHVWTDTPLFKKKQKK